MEFNFSDSQFSVISKMHHSGEFDGCDTITQSSLNGEIFVKWPEVNNITKTVAIARCGTVINHSHKKANIEEGMAI